MRNVKACSRICAVNIHGERSCEMQGSGNKTLSYAQFVSVQARSTVNNFLFFYKIYKQIVKVLLLAIALDSRTTSYILENTVV